MREEGVSLPMFFESFAFVGRGRSSSELSSIRKMSSKMEVREEGKEAGREEGREGGRQ